MLSVESRFPKGAKDSDVGPAQIRGEHEVPAPERAEVADRKKNGCPNVLLVGHAGAGKHEVKRKILELHFKHIKSKGNSEAEHAKDIKTEFGIPIETETTRFNMLLMPSSLCYVSKLMEKAKHADVAVFLISGCKDVLMDKEIGNHVLHCFCRVVALSIPNIVVVMNKMDDPTCLYQSFTYISELAAEAMKKIGAVDSKIVACLPISCKKWLNINTKLGEDDCTWWNGPCLFDVLEDIEVTERTYSFCEFVSTFNVFNLVKTLIRLDLNIETSPTESLSRIHKANVLATLGRFQDAFQEALEASQHFCATQDVSDVDEPFAPIVKGYYFRAKKYYKSALSFYGNAQRKFLVYKAKGLEMLKDIIKETEKEESEKNREFSIPKLSKKKKNKDLEFRDDEQNLFDGIGPTGLEPCETREVSIPKLSEKMKNKDLEEFRDDEQNLFDGIDPTGLELCESRAFVPPQWWSPHKCAQFIHILKRLRLEQDMMTFDGILGHALSRGDISYNFGDVIPSGILLAIHRKGKDKNDSCLPDGIDEKTLEEKGWIRAFPYKYNHDIIRYMVAVYSHYNQYVGCKEKKLNEEAIERCLRNIFPNIYIHLMDSLFRFSTRKSVPSGYAYEILEEVSRRLHL